MEKISGVESTRTFRFGSERKAFCLSSSSSLFFLRREGSPLFFFEGRRRLFFCSEMVLCCGKDLCPKCGLNRLLHGGFSKFSV
jgi:hypothetical protein